MKKRAVFMREWDGAEYVMSDEDVAMMARALWGEKHDVTCDPEEAAAICWTWLNRFMLWPGGMSKWGALKKLIKYHPQPVSPRWRRDGEFCKPGGEYAGTPNCSESRLKWRDKMAYTPMDQTPTAMKVYAEEFAAGELPYYPFIDFAGYGPGTQVVDGGEYYRTKDQTSANWKPGEVTIIGGTLKPDGLSTAAKVGIAAWLGAVAWAGYQLLKN